MRVAFVVQRYGNEVNGGAELECRSIAEHVNRHVPVDVLTTCAIDYYKWTNEYAPGISDLNGVRVHRFPVDQLRDFSKFQAITQRVLSGPTDLITQLEWMRAQGPISSGLLRAIAQARDTYDAFVFFTYLYAPTYYGIQLVPDKALLAPMAHDEPFIYLDIFRAVFHLPRYIVFNTEVEQQMTHRIFDNAYIPSSAVGVGVDMPPDVDADRFRAKYNLSGDFMIYIGRVDQGKNVHELFDYFLAFRAKHDRDLKLVIMGNGALPIPQHPDVVPLGFITGQDKFDGLAAATALVLPSKYESLSIAVLEAWLVNTPVLVNGECEVLKEQCRLSKGGLWYQSREEFVVALSELLDRPDLRRRLAEAGREFAATKYAWERIERCYMDILKRFDSNSIDMLPRRSLSHS
jgi:glycosyltransferase involved in cell wall biosynthesis